MSAKDMTEKDKAAQKRYFLKVEKDLGIGATGLARAMGIPYPSYADLKNARRKKRELHERVIELLYAVKGTPAGEEFGV